MNNLIGLSNDLDINNIGNINYQATLSGFDDNISFEEIEKIHNNVFYIKIASIIILGGVSLLFGIMPLMW